MRPASKQTFLAGGCYARSNGVEIILSQLGPNGLVNVVRLTEECLNALIAYAKGRQEEKETDESAESSHER